MQDIQDTYKIAGGPAGRPAGQAAGYFVDILYTCQPRLCCEGTAVPVTMVSDHLSMQYDTFDTGRDRHVYMVACVQPCETYLEVHVPPSCWKEAKGQYELQLLPWIALYIQTARARTHDMKRLSGRSHSPEAPIFTTYIPVNTYTQNIRW